MKAGRIVLTILFAICIFLLGWGTLGLTEFLIPGLNLGLQNELFPFGTQFLHWLLLVATGGIFTFGFLLRWKHTPAATIVMFGMLAVLCFIETVDFGAFGGGPTRFIPMTAEFVAYTGFGVFLARSAAVQDRFRRKPLASSGGKLPQPEIS